MLTRDIETLMRLKCFKVFVKYLITRYNSTFHSMRLEENDGCK